MGARDSCDGGGERLVSETGWWGGGKGGDTNGAGAEQRCGAGGAQGLSWIPSLQRSEAAAPGPRFAPLHVWVLRPRQRRPQCKGPGGTGGRPYPTPLLRGTPRCGRWDASVCLSVCLSVCPLLPSPLCSPQCPPSTRLAPVLFHIPNSQPPPRLLWAPIEEATPVCLQLNESQRGEQFPARVCVRI